MKLLLLLGITILGLVNIAQTDAIAQSLEDRPMVQTNPSPTALQTATSPLIQAGKELLSLERYELESVMEIVGDIPGTAFTSNAKINTIVEAPNKFNSQITFVSPDGLEGKVYQIVSDGSQVWIHNLATNQYSVSDIKQFLQTREGLLVGTLSYFYLNTRSNIGSSGVVANFLAKLPEDRLLQYFQRFSKLDLQNSIIRDETIEGQAYKAYDIDISDRGFQVTAYINSEGGNLERVYLSGTKDGLQLSSKERIINRTIPESIPVETFAFTPPENAERVQQQIAIAPF